MKLLNGILQRGRPSRILSRTTPGPAESSRFELHVLISSKPLLPFGSLFQFHPID